SASFGYFVSAMAGVGLVVLLSLVVRWLVSRKRSRRGFIEKTTRGLFNAIEQSLFAEEMAQSRGFLQSLDARVKLAGMGALILAAVAVHRIEAVAAILVFGVLLAFLSHVPIRVLATRVWIAVLAFTGVIALPAVFLTPGHVIYQTPILGWAITSQGIHSAVLLILRAEAAATLSVLLILCTLWTHLLRALRLFHVPVVLVVVIGMTYRYIFLFLQTARDMLDSREARMIGTLEPTERRRLAAASAGVLLGKSLQLSGEVHMAMQARGFRGEARLLEDLRMRGGDWTRLAAFACVAAIAVWLGR
ncbi:MAG TPA: cobalt ECF transporter T component CbiQ, partial [Bryobacteraceae bacterium]|nr:cobalt ECF transporter T component CbiQ [Bryobacteraceae bacterium]